MGISTIFCHGERKFCHCLQGLKKTVLHKELKKKQAAANGILLDEPSLIIDILMFFLTVFF
jgi:hypothetical protein